MADIVSMKKKGQTQGAIQRIFTKLTDDTTESEGLSKERSEDRIHQQESEDGRQPQAKDQGSPSPGQSEKT